MERQKIGIALVALLVTLSGCAQIDTTVEIGEDGELEQYDMDMQFSDEAWQLVQYAADSEGYDSIEAYIRNDTDTNESDDSAVDCVDGSEEINVNEEQQRVHFACSDPVIQNESAIDVTVQDDGSIVYQDVETAAWEQSLNGTEGTDLNVEEMTFNFTVIFPSEVTNSNADTVDGNAATWHLSEWEGGTLKAETGSASGTNGEEDGDTTDGDGGESDDGTADDSDDGTSDDSTDDSTDDGTDGTGEEGGSTDSGSGDGSESGTDGSDGDDDGGSGTVDGEDSEDSDGDGASGFTLAGVLVALGALIGLGLRRRH